MTVHIGGRYYICNAPPNTSQEIYFPHKFLSNLMFQELSTLSAEAMLFTIQLTVQVETHIFTEIKADLPK